MSKSLYSLDLIRYGDGKMPKFQKYYRKAQESKGKFLKAFYKYMLMKERAKFNIELYEKSKIGYGLYFGHYSGITINPDTIIGNNVNIHKGVTIGQENRGKRKGLPTIGNDVWIGVNSTIVGKITIGNDVLIAPNSYVNCDVPDHSIVFGNPAIIKNVEFATEGYIENRVDSI